MQVTFDVRPFSTTSHTRLPIAYVPVMMNPLRMVSMALRPLALYTGLKRRQRHLDIVAESFNLLDHRNVSLLNTAFGLNAQPQSGFSRHLRLLSQGASSAPSIMSSNRPQHHKDFSEGI